MLVAEQLDRDVKVDVGAERELCCLPGRVTGFEQLQLAPALDDGGGVVMVALHKITAPSHVTLT